MVDTRDLKSLAVKRGGSSPSTPKYSTYVEICKLSKNPKNKHATVIFKNGTLICFANNSGKYHAEVKALQIAKIYGYKRDLVLISLRVTKTGELTMAMPCPKCLRYIQQYKDITVMYSNEKGVIVKL